MIILHVSTRLILGGSQQAVVVTCAAQVASGHEVYLAYGPVYGPEGSLLDRARETGAHLVEVGPMRRALLPAHDYRCYRHLRRLMREIRPDVVHTHSSKAGILGRAAAWHERVPAVIHTVHGLPFHDHQPRLVHHAYVAAERWAARRCHRIVGVTQAMCDAFQEERIGVPEQFTVIPSGVEVARLTLVGHERAAVRRELGIPEDAPVVGMVARLDPLKGHHDLIAVLPALIESFPDLRVMFVGDGWHRAAVERQAQSVGLSDAIIFTGLASPERVRELLAAMDVVALPSYQEGQGSALVEALVAGCAIVGYDVGGIGEVCIDGVTGRLVSVGDRAALQHAIGALLADPRQRQELAVRGREHVTSRFDDRTMITRLERLYAEVGVPVR